MAEKFIQEAMAGVNIASKAKLVALIGILTEKFGFRVHATYVVFSCCGIGGRLIVPCTIVTPSKHCMWKNMARVYSTPLPPLHSHTVYNRGD